MTATISETVTVAGLTLSETTTVTAENAIIKDVSVPAGKAGTLTARTDNDTGSFTATAGGHGIVDGQIVDIYWAGGVRRGMTVGTVATNVIPLDGGAGDNLPTTTTAMTICARTALTVALTGSNQSFLGLYTPAGVRGSFALKESGNAYPINQTQIGVWHWTSGNGENNPLTGYTTTTLYLSHDQTSAQNMKFVAMGS